MRSSICCGVGCGVLLSDLSGVSLRHGFVCCSGLGQGVQLTGMTGIECQLVSKRNGALAVLA